MGVSLPKNIGSHIKDIAAIIPQAFTAGTTAPKTSGMTPSVDRSTYNFPQSATVHLNCGKTSSNPSVATAQVQVWHSDDNTTFTKYVPPPIAGVVQTDATSAALDCSAAAADGEVDVDLSGAGRYVALQLVTAFTGGTSPAIIVGATWSFGGAMQEPI